jgi:hypothetical protein
MLESCHLCKATAPLVRSHILPAGLYRKLLDHGAKNSNPFHVSNGKAIQSSRQITKHLLCERCERRLNDNGERWMIAKCYDDRQKVFPLRELLLAKGKIGHGSLVTSAATADIPELSNSQLEYFAASVFWRASVQDRLATRQVHSVALGPFEEEFRRYLVGDAPFPSRSTLLVYISTAEPPYKSLSYPITTRHPAGSHAHRFVIPGICFDLYAGKRAVDTHRACFVHSPEHFVFLNRYIENWVAESCFQLAGNFLNNA